jgi:hypothetical protein
VAGAVGHAAGPASRPGPLTHPPTLDDAVTGDAASSVSSQERSAIDSALSGFEPIASRPVPMQSAHQPGAYEPVQAPMSRLRLLGIGVALACLLGVVSAAIWQVVDRQQADGVVRAGQAASPPGPPAAMVESPAAKRRNRPMTGPEGRDIQIPPLPQQP